MANFRARARTVDMLGRQQTAGIPTSISELFKNAHDAYATQVEVDFYRPEQLLVLRDNGLGMTLKDVQDRWLVIGTESKLGGSDELTAVASTLGKAPRRLTGEKGIGRLAIAAIGNQVLLLTRARRDDGLYPTVAAFINWSLFALPRISLDEIEIPIQEFPDGGLPTAADVAALVGTVRDNVERLRDRIEPEKAKRIEQELSKVCVDPAALQERFDSAALGGNATGTQFYIQPTDPMLKIILDTGFEGRRIGDLQKTLTGFTNTMMPGRDKPPIAAEFRDHHSADLYDSLIGPEKFFTPEEFRSADHHIHGSFDAYGQFTGTVSVYGKEPEPHTIAWPEAKGRPTKCGVFDINVAYVQGMANESRIEREQWGALIDKLNKKGGLYIYRNGIRILPYGNTDYDFLHVEERRTLSAGYYFFSYRRMFGAIELPADSSERLSEKAGREGFRENQAYRQFRAILENFFIQLAVDYFRDEALKGAQYSQIKTDLDRQAKARERQAKQSLVRRRALETTLKDSAERLSRGAAGVAIEAIVKQLAAETEGAQYRADPESQAQAILGAESTARRGLSELKEGFRIKQPRGFGLNKALRRNLDAYRDEYAKHEEEVFKPALAKIEAVVSAAVGEFNIAVDRRRRFDSSTQTIQGLAKSKLNEHKRTSKTNLDNTNQKVSGAIRQAMVDFDTTLSEITQRMQRTDLTPLTDAEIVELRLDLDSEIDAVALEKGELLDTISQQLEAITVTPDGSGQLITGLDVVAATEEELLALQERAEVDLELTQLGMAIEIINHEFQSTIRSIRNNLRRLKAWADVNKQLSDVYQDIRINFEHLDGYLTLFTPLHRRLYREKIQIKGSEIDKFLTDLFRERLERHRIDVKATRAFLGHQVTGYPSTFYPVFVNLIDNAIFWIKDKPLPHNIRLDVAGETMSVADNGPGVSPRDREAIFEMGFTRKPAGRGLGLYISRDVLKRVGYDLTLEEPVAGPGSVFLIQPEVKK